MTSSDDSSPVVSVTQYDPDTVQEIKRDYQLTHEPDAAFLSELRDKNEVEPDRTITAKEVKDLYDEFARSMTKRMDK